MSGRWFLPRRFCVGPGRVSTLGSGGEWVVSLVAREGPCVSPGVRFADLPGVVVTGAAGCAVSEGLRGFMLEFTLL